MNEIVPYTCLFVDADLKHYSQAISCCLKSNVNREKVVDDLASMWTNTGNQNKVLPCMSVRSGLDLYLKVMNFPAGSEVIMSAINIPDMVRVVQHHNLKVVPWDISIETTEPKLELLPSLVSDKSVAIIIAHIYGKWCDMDPIIDAAEKYNLAVIEDCAEAFCGFERIGNPRSDIALFSFGVIKFFTAFGGSIAKIKSDDVYKKMMDVYETYAMQTRTDYLKRTCKSIAGYVALCAPCWTGFLMYTFKLFGGDMKTAVLAMLRGFPDGMLQRIKVRPSSSLLLMLRKRLRNFSQSEYDSGQVKGEYVRMRLPEEAQLVGMKAMVNNYWLFPILVEDPDTILNTLNGMGVDAYRGATQLNIIEPENPANTPVSPLDPKYPAEARYLIDHIVYIPAHKNVPFHALNKICKSVHQAIKLSKDSPRVRLQSKL